MNNITQYFTLPGGAEAAGLNQGFIHTNEKLSFQGIRLSRVLESNDIGTANVAKECFVEMGHLLCVNQVNAKLVIPVGKKFVYQFPSDLAQERTVDAAGALVAAYDQSVLTAHSRHARTDVWRDALRKP